MNNQSEKDLLKEKTASIIVIPFDMDKINSDLDAFIKQEAEKAEGSSFAPKIGENEFFKMNGKMGVIKGTNICIDDECIGEASEVIHSSIYSEERDENGKTKSFGMFPRFSFKFDIKEYLRDYGMAEISLEEFMGNRFAYNPRVCSNMNIIIKEIKTQCTQK